MRSERGGGTFDVGPSGGGERGAAAVDSTVQAARGNLQDQRGGTKRMSSWMVNLPTAPLFSHMDALARWS